MLYLMNNLRLHNFSIHRNFHQNRFIIEYAIKKEAKNHGITDFFLVLYVLNKLTSKQRYLIQMLENNLDTELVSCEEIG